MSEKEKAEKVVYFDPSFKQPKCLEEIKEIFTEKEIKWEPLDLECKQPLLSKIIENEAYELYKKQKGDEKMNKVKKIAKISHLVSYISLIAMFIIYFLTTLIIDNKSYVSDTTAEIVDIILLVVAVINGLLIVWNLIIFLIKWYLNKKS